MRNVVLASIAFEARDVTSVIVLLLDADALPNQNAGGVLQALKGSAHHGLYIVPAFDLEGDDIPIDKAKLAQLFHTKQADIMCAAHSRSYSFDHLEQWLDCNKKAMLPFKYKIYNEPYLVAPLSTYLAHEFDEAFIGRGYNKQSFHFELWASGAYKDAMVLPNTFIVNLKNPAGSMQQVSTAMQVWKAFRENVMARFGLNCREAFWRLCDERGMYCDEICTPTPLQQYAILPPALHDDDVVLPIGPKPFFPIPKQACLVKRQVDVVFSREWPLALLPFAIQSLQTYAGDWTRHIYVQHPSALISNNRVKQFNPTHDSTTPCSLFIPPGWFLLEPLSMDALWEDGKDLPCSMVFSTQLLTTWELSLEDYSLAFAQTYLLPPSISPPASHRVLRVQARESRRALWELQWKHKGKYEWLQLGGDFESTPRELNELAKLFPPS